MKSAKASTDTLSMEQYEAIRKPKEGHPVKVYASIVPDLFNKVMAPFMDWMSPHEMDMMPHGDMQQHDGKDMEHDDMQMPQNEHGQMNHGMHHDMQSMPMENKKMEDKK